LPILWWYIDIRRKIVICNCNSCKRHIIVTNNCPLYLL
jgi:hypothetical protein